MSRVDVYKTEADFIEFHFTDQEAASKAEKIFPIDLVRSTPTVIEYRPGLGPMIEDIRRKLEAAGLEWTEAESSLTEEDMWPEWPEDSEETDSPAP